MFNEKLPDIKEVEGSLNEFSIAYKRIGLNLVDGGAEYHEWAPAAKEMYIFDDFNNWNRHE